MELMQYIEVIRKWIWLLVLSVALAAGASLIASLLATPVYRTTTTLMVSQTISNPNPDSGDLYASQQLAQTYVQLITKEPILKATAESLGLKQNWESLKGQVSAVPIQGTQLIEISVIDTSPARAQAIANEIARQVILQSPTTPSPDRQERIVFIQSQLPELESRIKQAQKDVLAIGEQISIANSARQIQDLSQQQTILNTQITQWQTTYSQMLEALNQGTLNSLSVVEPASIPKTPISPNIKLNVIVAAFIGLVLALGGAFLLEYLDDSIRSPEEAQKLLDVPVLSVVSQIDNDDKLISFHEPRSPITESYRELRTNLQFSSLDHPLKTILVTSPSPSEGKSVSASNLSVVLAQAGLSVILIDADLRRPTIHKIFGLQNKTGLTGCLIENDASSLGSGGDKDGLADNSQWKNLDNYLQDGGVPGLRIITSGSLPPNPAEVLGSGRMRRFLLAVSNLADMVIIDSPPCAAVTDAVVLSRSVDGVILVLDAHKSARQAAKRAKSSIIGVGGNLMGVVINRLARDRGGYYYSKYYPAYYYDDDHESVKQKDKLTAKKRRAVNLNGPRDIGGARDGADSNALDAKNTNEVENRGD